MRQSKELHKRFALQPGTYRLLQPHTAA